MIKNIKYVVISEDKVFLLPLVIQYSVTTFALLYYSIVAIHNRALVA